MIRKLLVLTILQISIFSQCANNGNAPIYYATGTYITTLPPLSITPCANKICICTGQIEQGAAGNGGMIFFSWTSKINSLVMGANTPGTSGFKEAKSMSFIINASDIPTYTPSNFGKDSVSYVVICTQAQ